MNLEYSVKVTAKKAGKTVKKTLTAAITVKTPAVRFKDADNKNINTMEIAVGESVTLKAASAPKSSKIKFVSADKSVATVGLTSGKLTGVKAGDVKITAKNALGASYDLNVTVKTAVLKSVKQTSTTTLEAVFAGDTATLKTSDIVITNTYSKANVAIKSITVDSTDKTKVNLETYVAMNDGKDYTVVYDGTTKTFTATDGKVVAATISPATVTVPTPKDAKDGSNANDIVVSFTDANGVKIAEVKKSTAITNKPADFTSIDIDVDATNNGYMFGDKLILYKAGNTAKVKVTAHTGKYDASAQEIGNITAEATITGVDAAVVTTTGYTAKVVGKLSDATEFKNVKESQVAVKDSAYAYIQVAKSNNEATKVDAKYTYESSNSDVMTVAYYGTLDDATIVSIQPYKAGSAYIIVKDDKAVVATLPVTIGAERKATTLVLDKNAFTVSDAVDDDVTVEATVKDQYGDDFAISGLQYKLAAENDSQFTNTGVSGKKITVVVPTVTKDESFTYIVKANDLKATFVISVKKAGDVATYALELSADSVDAIVKADAEKDTVITASVCGYDANGVKAYKDVAATFKLQKDGKDAEDVVGNSTSSKIQINDISSGKQMADGTYLVTATTTADKKVFTKTFTVTNSQPEALGALDSTEVKAANAKKLSDLLKIKYNNNDAKNFDIVKVNGTAMNDMTFDVVGATHIDTVVVKIYLNDGKTIAVEKTISLGKTIVVK